jgi:hypothetical protein
MLLYYRCLGLKSNEIGFFPADDLYKFIMRYPLGYAIEPGHFITAVLKQGSGCRRDKRIDIGWLFKELELPVLA